MSIREIWDKVCEGDHRAWQELVRLYSALVYTVARRAGLSESDAEDCAQHTWLTLFRRRHHIRDPQALPAWLIQTTHRRSLLVSRRINRSKTSLDTDLAPTQPSLPDEVVDSLIRSATLQSAIIKLNPRCQKLLNSLYFSNKQISYSDLAAELGIKTNSLGPLRGRCLEKLKKILEEMGFEPDF